MNKIKSIIRKLKNKDITTIRTNSAFTTFYHELKFHFTGQNLFNISIEIINDRFFMSDNNITKCEAILLYHPDICKIVFLPTKESTSIELSRFEIFKTDQAIGSTFMDIFKNISVKTSIEILVKPSVPGIDNLSDVEFDEYMNKVRNFYHKQGFKRKGLKTKYWSNIA